MIFYLIFWFYSQTLRGGCCSGSRPGHLPMRRSMPKYPQAGILSCPPIRSLEYKCSIKRHFGIKKSPWVNEASCVKRFECLSSAKKHYFQTSPFQISFLPVCENVTKCNPLRIPLYLDTILLYALTNPIIKEMHFIRWERF